MIQHQHQHQQRPCPCPASAPLVEPAPYPAAPKAPKLTVNDNRKRGRGRCFDLIGRALCTAAIVATADAPIPGAIKAVNQLVVSRYGRLQGATSPFDARLTGPIRTSAVQRPSNWGCNTTSGLDAASAWQHNSRHLQFCFSILIMSGPLSQAHGQLVLQKAASHILPGPTSSPGLDSLPCYCTVSTVLLLDPRVI